MSQTPIVKTVTIKASAEQVWSAITEAKKMRLWYFDISDFEARVGFCFEFLSSTEEHNWLQKCEIVEVVPNKKLSYSWKYEGIPGESTVCFELEQQALETTLTLTHKGIENFSFEHPDLRVENFNDGWESIIKDSLRNYVEHYP